MCVHSVAHVTLASRKLGKLKSEGNLRHPLCIISTPSIALYDQKEIPKISAFFRERSGVNLTPYDPASLGASQKPGFCIACLRVLMEPGILRWFTGAGGVQTAKASRKQSSLSGKESAQGCIPMHVPPYERQG